MKVIKQTDKIRFSCIRLLMMSLFYHFLSIQTCILRKFSVIEEGNTLFTGKGMIIIVLGGIYIPQYKEIKFYRHLYLKSLLNWCTAYWQDKIFLRSIESVYLITENSF